MNPSLASGILILFGIAMGYLFKFLSDRYHHKKEEARKLWHEQRKKSREEKMRSALSDQFKVVARILADAFLRKHAVVVDYVHIMPTIKFFEDYLEMVRLDAEGKISEYSQQLSASGSGSYDRLFQMVFDLESKRAGLIFKIRICGKDDGGANRRPLEESEKLAFLSAFDDDSEFPSNCHVCHGGNDVKCPWDHDEHEPCHDKELCEPTCEVASVIYFNPYNADELLAKLKNLKGMIDEGLLDLDIDSEIRRNESDSNQDTGGEGGT